MSYTKLSFLSPRLSEIRMLFEKPRIREFEIGLVEGNYLYSCNELESFKCNFKYSLSYTPRINLLTPLGYAGSRIRYDLIPYSTDILKSGTQGYITGIDIGAGGTCDVGPYLLPHQKLSKYSTNQLYCDLYASGGVYAKLPGQLKFQMPSGYANINTQ